MINKPFTSRVRAKRIAKDLGSTKKVGSVRCDKTGHPDDYVLIGGYFTTEHLHSDRGEMGVEISLDSQIGQLVGGKFNTAIFSMNSLNKNSLS